MSFSSLTLCPSCSSTSLRATIPMNPIASFSFLFLLCRRVQLRYWCVTPHRRVAALRTYDTRTLHLPARCNAPQFFGLCLETNPSRACYGNPMHLRCYSPAADSISTGGDSAVEIHSKDFCLSNYSPRMLSSSGNSAADIHKESP